MVSGITLGAFADSVRAGRQQDLQRRQLDLQQRQQQIADQRGQEEGRQFRLDRTQQALEQRTELMQNIIGNYTGSHEDPQLIETLRPLVEDARVLVDSARASYPELPWDSVWTNIQAIVENTPTATMRAQNEAATTVAGADALAGATGVGRNDVLRAGGNLPAAGNVRGVIDSTTGQTAFATDAQIAAEPGRYQPIPSGMSLRTNPDGSVSLDTGTRGAGGGNERPIRTEIQRVILDSTNALSRALRTADTFNQDFLTIPTRLNAAWAELQDRINPDSLSDEQRQLVSEFSSFRQAAFSDLNRTIADLSGAAVTESEERRFARELPSAGTGIFDGDSPQEFQTKLENRVRDLQRIILRARIWDLEGTTATPMDMMGYDNGDVERWVSRRSQSIRQRLSLESNGWADLTAEEQDTRVEAELNRQLNQAFTQ